MALDLSTLTTEEQIAAIYIGYYDRAGEPDGSNFWEAVLENPGFSLADIASDFAVQDETTTEYPFFENPSEEEANAFITQVYLNLFNRAPEGPDDVEEGVLDGLTFWSDALIAAINGDEGAMSVGEIILAIIQGAQDTAEFNDLSTIRNKIEVATAWTAAAEAAGETAAFNELSANVQNSATSIIVGVDGTQGSVSTALATIESVFEPEGVDGETFTLKVGIDAVTGTADNDLFVAQIGQSEFVGGVSNTLATGDMVDGGAGNDRLFANITNEFVGTNLVNQTDIHPLIKNVEVIDIRAADNGVSGGSFDIFDIFDPIDLGEGEFLGGIEDIIDNVFEGLEILFGGFNDQTVIVDGGVVGSDGVYFNGILGHEKIGSYFSDGDLIIENLTTYDSNGVARNTSEITVTMDHTDNFNSDGDASDLAVLFDNDYLLAGEVSEFQIQLRIVNTLELAQNNDPLNSFDSVTFTVGDTEVTVGIEGLATYAEVRNAINAELAALGLTGVTAELAEDRTAIFTDDIEEFAQGDLAGEYTPINIVSTDQELVVGPIELLSDVTDFNGLNTWVAGGEVTTQDPISIDIELHKVGRGGEGGDLIVGGKANFVNEGIAGGIEVFNITVKGVGGSGADAKPSNLGTIASTLGALKTINIETDAVTAQGDSYASLVVRDSVGDAETVNANDFLGNLTLGSDTPIENLHTLTALGGGDVSFTGTIDEEDIVYSYTTGAGDDNVNVTMDGDALDYNDSELLIDTGAGDDEIMVTFDPDTPEGGLEGITGPFTNQQLNQAILDNVRINGGEGNDTITVDGIGNARIFGDAGNDIIYTDGTAAARTAGEGDEGAPADTNAIWALNFDAVRAAANGGIGNSDADDLPGVENTLAYIGGATVTVTLSGAGEDIITSGLAAGGGVMAFDIAADGLNGYEADATVTVAGPLTHYGTQQDINNAVRAAIEGDAVLNALLEVVEGANNTLVIVSRTSGDFVFDDLRIDIDQRDVTSAAAADEVVTEARTVFQNSALTATDLFGPGPYSAGSPGVYQAGAPAGEAGDLTSSFAANLWYNGLSIDGENLTAFNPSMADNLHTRGNASDAETDNVINGGAGDDIIVLSTDATVGGSVAYTPGGNNAMINGASNETIVMTGANFGNDTVMNFTTAVPVAAGEPVPIPVTVAAVVPGSNIDGGQEFVETPGTPETLDLEIETGAATAQPYTLSILGVSIDVPGGSTQAEIGALIEAAFGEGNGTGFTAEVTDSAGTPVIVTFTATENGDIADDDLPTVADNVSGPANVLLALDFVQAPDGSDDGSDDVLGLTEEVLVVEYFGLPAVLGDDDEISIVLTGLFPGSPLTITIDQTNPGFTPGLSGEDLATLVAAEIESGTSSQVTATVVGNVVTYTANDPGAAEDIDIDFTIDHVVDGVFDLEDTVAQGLDFLDFTAYLTSQFDSSTNPPGTDSDVSNQLIDVSLDYNEDNTLGGSGDGAADADVEANEVAVVRMTDGSGDTFAGLTAADVAALFNSSAASNDYANLAASTFDVIDSQSDNAVVDGAAKAIFMVEDGGNLGHYKVFELSWDASEDDGDEGVTANAIGSLDFGTSLTNLDDVNLVGSDDYALLNEVGILNYGV